MARVDQINNLCPNHNGHPSRHIAYNRQSIHSGNSTASFRRPTMSYILPKWVASYRPIVLFVAYQS